MKNQKGFTLVEMAVVLVIIGILMGAILKGQELIKSAKEKKFFTQIRYLATVQYTFLDRMGHYAGDRDGDGIIDDNDRAWDELKRQQLIGDNDKKHVFNGIFSYGGGIDPYRNYNYIKATRVPCWVARSFDTKNDNGNTYSDSRMGRYGYVRWGSPNGMNYDLSNPAIARDMYWWYDR